jgi:Na+-transporting methylmalonyl-CoA/oxaloacetate decarboxylase gamma subunit
MDPSQISLGTAGLVIFVLCVGFVFLRGVVRLFFGALVLGGSLLVGFLVWQKTPGWMIGLMGKPVEWVSIALPAVAFLATFIVCRAVIGFFLKPFKRSADSGAGTPGGILFRLVFSLIPTAFLWLVGAAVVHHFGSIVEVEKSADPKKEQEADWIGRFAELKTAIAAIIPQEWLKKVDPLADPEHLSLAKWFASQSGPKAPELIDPETKKPYPRALIVEEPELQHLADDGKFSTLIRHPLLEKALNDPKVREAVRQQMNRR